MSPAGIAYDRAGPRGDLPVVLIHAGIADRRMWDPQWSALTAVRDVVRLDLRGFGESTERPHGQLSPVDDVLDTLAGLGVGRCHLVGASFGAGVAVEVALTSPEQVDSLLLAAPGGSLIAEATPDLRAFIDAERSAMARDDLAEAVEANLTWWVDGPRRDARAVDSTVRDSVRRMQRRAFELTADWDDVEEKELDPPALDPTNSRTGDRGNRRRASRRLAGHRASTVDGAPRRLPGTATRLVDVLSATGSHIRNEQPGCGDR